MQGYGKRFGHVSLQLRTLRKYMFRARSINRRIRLYQELSSTRVKNCRLIGAPRSKYTARVFMSRLPYGICG